MRLEVDEKHGLYNLHLIPIATGSASDYDYMLRIFRDTSLSFCYLPEVITKMRLGGMSTGGLKNLLNKRKEDYWVLKNNKMPFPLWILFVKECLPAGADLQSAPLNQGFLIPILPNLLIQRFLCVVRFMENIVCTTSI